MRIESLLVDLDGTLLGNTGLRLSLDFVARAVSTLRPRLGVRGSLQTLVEIKKAFDLNLSAVLAVVALASLVALLIQVPIAFWSDRLPRTKIALLGASIPILNPVRVAEEFAMLDTITNGRIIAGMLRATPKRA